jgi:hypothetical protein
MLRHVSLVRTDVSEERLFLQKPHGVMSQKTAFFSLKVVKQNISYVAYTEFTFCADAILI